jgi:hypothetical protein
MLMGYVVWKFKIRGPFSVCRILGNIFQRNVLTFMGHCVWDTVAKSSTVVMGGIPT